MSRSFQIVNLSIDYLAMVMADSKENSLNLLHSFLNEHHVEISDEYEFQFSISQGGKKHILYL
jgi:hypothetical protein